MSTAIFSLEDKVAIVTGASAGSDAIALGFAEAGADVALAARSEGDLATLATEIGAIGRKAIVVPTDVTQRDALENLVQRTLEELGKLDVLVNNAGGSNFVSPLIGLRPAGWDKLRTLNLDSVFPRPNWPPKRWSSTAARSSRSPRSQVCKRAQGLSPYSAAKGGVLLFSQAVAKELAAANVRVNSIAPGWIDTPLNDWMTKDEAALEFAKSMIPMGRIGTAEEIVGAAIYLASDASSFVTGTTLVIDGGQTAQDFRSSGCSLPCPRLVYGPSLGNVVGDLGPRQCIAGIAVGGRCREDNPGHVSGEGDEGPPESPCRTGDLIAYTSRLTSSRP